MPIATEIDHKSKRVRFTLNGQIATAEMIQAIDDARAGLGDRAGYDVLSDNRGVTVPATAEQVKALVEKLRAIETFKARRAAIVVSSEASYGMMRMLSAMVEPMQLELRGFRDL